MKLGIEVATEGPPSSPFVEEVEKDGLRREREKNGGDAVPSSSHLGGQIVFGFL